MTIIKPQNRKPCLDLRGPDGNAFVLLGSARSIGMQLGWDKKKIDGILADMMSSDYKNLVTLFDKNFGHCVDIILPPTLDL